MNKYIRTIHPSSTESAFSPIEVDVYSVLVAFNVTNPAIQHAVKKLLCPGQRGSKTEVTDLEEAIVAIQRAIGLVKQSPSWVGGRVLDALKQDAQEQKLEAATKPPELQTVSPEVFARANARLSPRQAKFVGETAEAMKKRAAAERRAEYQLAYRARKKAARK